MRSYVAKGNHTKPCCICNQAIVKNDSCRSWGYRDDEGYVKVMRAHRSCHAIYLDNDYTPETWHNFAFEHAPVLLDEARTALKAARGE